MARVEPNHIVDKFITWKNSLLIVVILLMVYLDQSEHVLLLSIFNARVAMLEKKSPRLLN